MLGNNRAYEEWWEYWMSKLPRCPAEVQGKTEPGNSDLVLGVERRIQMLRRPVRTIHPIQSRVAIGATSSFEEES